MVFTPILRGPLSLSWSAPPATSTSDRRALVTCWVVKGKMTGIHSPPEPVKQRGDSLWECHSIMWKQCRPRQGQTPSVCDGDSQGRGRFPCRRLRTRGSQTWLVYLSTCLPNTGFNLFGPRKPCTNVLRINRSTSKGYFLSNWEGRFWKSLSAGQNSNVGWRVKGEEAKETKAGCYHTAGPFRSSKHWQAWLLSPGTSSQPVERWKEILNQ